MFDLGMLRLENRLARSRAFHEGWFRREYKEVEYSTDIAMLWRAKDQIMIHRNLKGRANLSTCTIAVETLRSALTSPFGVEDFLQETFWHNSAQAPDWLKQLGHSVVLVGEVYDGDATEASSKFFWCESRLDEQQVRILKTMPSYR